MIRTIQELKDAYYEKHPDYHFFDPETLKFFGERLSEMYLYKKTEKVKDICGEEHTCYVIRSVQHKHPVHSHKTVYHYFDTETLDTVAFE